MDKKLRRSRTDRWLGGVCGGLGEFFGISAFWFRLLFFILGGLYLLRKVPDHRSKE